MKYLAAFLCLLFLPSFLWAGTCGVGYGFYRTVTIDHTKVPSADQSNYPMGFITTQSYLAVSGSGGDVQSSSGYDIIFCDAASGGNQLSHEIEKYVSATGEVEFWVKVPSISHTSDTVIYLFYGKAGVSDTEDVHNVWSNGYAEVYHLSATTGTPGLHDSTSTGNDLTNHGGTNTTGQIDGAIGFSSAYLDGSADSTDTTWSAEAWVNLASCGSGNPAVISTYSVAVTKGWALFFIGSTCNPALLFRGSTGDCYVDQNAISTGATHFLIGTITNTTANMYTDASNAGDTSFMSCGSSAMSHSTEKLTIGANPADVGGGFFPGGWIDEVRKSTVVRDGNWITMQYNNLHSPSTFYTIGSSVAPSSGVRHSSKVY